MTPSLFPPTDAIAVTGPAFEVLSPRSWVFRIPCELRSPNKTIWRPWTALAGDRANWERQFSNALLEFKALRRVVGFDADEAAAWPHVREHREIRSLAVSRYVPKRAQFMRDDRNLQFSIKGLEDALVRLKLLVDDRTAWLTSHPVTQALSPTGHFLTVVLLQRPDLAGVEARHG